MSLLGHSFPAFAFIVRRLYVINDSPRKIRNRRKFNYLIATLDFDVHDDGLAAVILRNSLVVVALNAMFCDL